jgi:uncharacterized membrane protein YhaH (DUF805 family)
MSSIIDGRTPSLGDPMKKLFAFDGRDDEFQFSRIIASLAGVNYLHSAVANLRFWLSSVLGLNSTLAFKAAYGEFVVFAFVQFFMIWMYSAACARRLRHAGRPATMAAIPFTLAFLCFFPSFFLFGRVWPVSVIQSIAGSGFAQLSLLIATIVIFKAKPKNSALA